MQDDSSETAPDTSAADPIDQAFTSEARDHFRKYQETTVPGRSRIDRETYEAVLYILKQDAGESVAGLPGKEHVTDKLTSLARRDYELCEGGIKKKDDGRRVISPMEMFDIVAKAHLMSPNSDGHHRGVRPTYSWIVDRYFGITRDDVSALVKLCSSCARFYEGRETNVGDGHDNSEAKHERPAKRARVSLPTSIQSTDLVDSSELQSPKPTHAPAPRWSSINRIDHIEKERDNTHPVHITSRSTTPRDGIGSGGEKDMQFESTKDGLMGQMRKMKAIISDLRKRNRELEEENKMHKAFILKMHAEMASVNEEAMEEDSK